MGRIFETIGNTFQIFKLSWRVLQQDRELIFFPILAGLGALLVGGIAVGVFAANGIFESERETDLGLIELIVALIAYFGGLYITIFCNSALIAAARERLEGGDPNIASGFRAVRGMAGAILGWTLITGTVGLILQALQAAANSSESPAMRIVGQLLIGLVGAVWAYITFFVIPILVVERVGPIEAIRRSSSLFKRTWGEQLTASFSFSIAYFLAVLLALVPVLAVYFLSPIAPITLAIITGIVVVGLTLAIVNAMEGIFKAALYEWVSAGKGSEWFDERLLRNAWTQR